MEGIMANARQMLNEKLMAMLIYEATEIDNPSTFMATPPDDYIVDDEDAFRRNADRFPTYRT